MHVAERADGARTADGNDVGRAALFRLVRDDLRDHGFVVTHGEHRIDGGDEADLGAVQVVEQQIALGLAGDRSSP